MFGKATGRVSINAAISMFGSDKIGAAKYFRYSDFSPNKEDLIDE